MVSLHKHGGSRRQSKGWEVFKPRQEGMRRGRRVDGTDPSGRRSVRVLSTLSVVCAAVGTQGAAVRRLLCSSSFFFVVWDLSPRPLHHRRPPSARWVAVGHSLSLTSSAFLLHVPLRLLHWINDAGGGSGAFAPSRDPLVAKHKSGGGGAGRFGSLRELPTWLHSRHTTLSSFAPPLIVLLFSLVFPKIFALTSWNDSNDLTFYLYM